MMMMEGGGLVEQRRGDGYGISGGNGHKTMKRKGVRRRTARIRPDPPPSPPSPPLAAARRRRRRNTLQELYESCLDVFKGPGTVPSSMDVQRLCNILDNMKPEDVGLTKDLPFFQNNGTCNGTPRVTNTTIYQCNNFSLCIFFLPATAVIPLHNHPGMTVFSKLLWGTMHIKSYDLVSPSNSDNGLVPQSNQLRLARLVADSEFTAPCNTSVLYPTTGGNIHQFTSITPCAVLDVMGPPYSQEDGRDCSYYKDFPYASLSHVAGVTGETREEGKGHQRYGWLEEIEPPMDSRMDVIEYLGPQITESDC